MSSESEDLKTGYTRSRLSWYWAPIYAISWFLVFYFVVVNSFNCLPRIIKTSDEVAHEGRFIGERAEQTLLKLTEIGPKPVGSSANEQTVIEVLLNEIGNITKDARKDVYKIEHEVQVASGNFTWRKIVHAYQSIQNVIVKVTPNNVRSNVSLLLNTHFDTSHCSPGAGDAGLMVAVMLETLRVITNYETPMNYSIIFLFNGAEENSLQGAHAFITQHRWAKNVSVVLNLDSIGSGGREMLFRAGPGAWLVKYYGAHAVHPFGTTLAEEFFDTGYIPADSDFSMFRKSGNLSGLDMASILNGYVYHTKYDRFNVVPRGSYQSTGENVLALTKALASAPELENPMEQSQDKVIYFDVLGWFFFSCNETTAWIVNSVVCILAIATVLAYIWKMPYQTGIFRRDIFGKFCILLTIQVSSVLLASLLTMTIATLMDIFGLPLSWYSQKWMIFGLYFCPMFFVLGMLPAIYLGNVKKHGLPLGCAIQLLMHSHCLILVVVTVALTAFGIRSAFFFMICIAFYTISVVLNIVTCFYNKTFLWLIPHMVCQLLPFIFFTYICYLFLEVIIPISGRSGSDINPELILAGIVILMSLLLAAFLIPVFSLFRRSKLILSSFALICVAFIILAVTPIGFPYVENESTQRIIAEHSESNFYRKAPKMCRYNSYSEFNVYSEDRRTNTLGMMFKDVNLNGPGYCSIPFLCVYFRSIKVRKWKDKVSISAAPPQPGGWPTMRILNKRDTPTKKVLYSLEVSGPDYMEIRITPLDCSKLLDWSFDQEVIKRNEDDSYFISYIYARDPAPLQFDLEFECENSNSSEPAFELVVKGHKIHHENLFTEEFREFLAKFPSWAHVEAWGADVNTEINGRYPLHYAAGYSQHEVLEFLIKKGANVNLKDKHGISPILAAIWEGHTKCVQLLLDKGASKNGQTLDGKMLS